MMKTQLEKAVCAKVWDLSNPKKEDTFNKMMFLIAMHLMYKKRQDPNCKLPEHNVPQELYVSANEDNVNAAAAAAFAEAKPSF